VTDQDDRCFLASFVIGSSLVGECLPLPIAVDRGIYVTPLQSESMPSEKMFSNPRRR
jgi:hypothetical protein